MTFNTPTLLTFFRIALIPVFVVVFFLPFAWTNLAATAIFGLASLTDWLDGYLARRWNQVSRFGAFLDPVADKLIVSTALVLLVQSHPTILYAIAASIIIGREISISALREWMAEIGEGGTVQVAWLGKLKTTAQIIAVLLLLYREPLPLLGWPSEPIGEAALYIAAALTVWSMFHYLRAAWPVMRKG